MGSSLRVDPLKVRQVIAETETALTLLRESIDARQALLDDEERYAASLEQRLALLRSHLEATMPP